MTDEQIESISRSAIRAIRSERDFYEESDCEISEDEIYAEVIKALNYQQRHFDKYNRRKANSYTNDNRRKNK